MRASVTILINSSNPFTSQQLKHLLSPYNPKTVYSQALPNGLNELQKNNFDVAFIDLEDPYFNTTHLLNQLGKNTRCHLIAVHSGTKGFSETILPHTFNDHLTKPFLEKTITTIMTPIIEESVHHSNNTLTADFLSSLLKKTQNNKKLAQTMLKCCFDDFPKQLSELKAHLAQHNIEQLQNCAHKLNGSAAFCGFTSIQQAAQKLEKLAQTHATKELASAFETLEKSVQSLINHQEQLLDQLKE